MLVSTLTELSPRDDKEIVRLGSGDSPMWMDETYTTSVLNPIGYVKTIVLSTFPHCLFSVNNHICIMSRLFTYANFDVALIKGPNNSRRIVIRANVRHMSSISRFAEINWECII